VFLSLEILPGDKDLLLKSAQVDIVQPHFGRQRDQHLPPVLPGGLQVGLRRLDPPSCATKDVQLPGRIEACLEEIAGGGHDRGLQGRRS